LKTVKIASAEIRNLILASFVMIVARKMSRKAMRVVLRSEEDFMYLRICRKTKITEIMELGAINQVQIEH